jgi:hypothetical protein
VQHAPLFAQGGRLVSVALCRAIPSTPVTRREGRERLYDYSSQATPSFDDLPRRLGLRGYPMPMGDPS